MSLTGCTNGLWRLLSVRQGHHTGVEADSTLKVTSLRRTGGC